MYSAPSEGQRLETGENQGSYPALLYIYVLQGTAIPGKTHCPPLEEAQRGYREREVENPI